MAGLEGTHLGAYELLERIGGGGMAEVYRAKQLTAFGREVAIKVIRPGFTEDTTFRERFLREAQAISKLSHPNILPLIEFGEENGILYLVMPLAREGTLRDLLKQRNGPLPPEEAIPLFVQLCDAVQYAHEEGIIHRDIKPQNVLLQRRTHVLLADFGIARDSAETQLTATGAGIGTVEYMAPEQAVGKADARSDIYSLGIVLYQLITGTVPYSGSTPFEIMIKHTNEALPDPRLLNPRLPAEVVQVLQTALDKDPRRRFQSAQALGRAVQQMRPDIAPGTVAPRPPGAILPGGPPPAAITRAPQTPPGNPGTWHGQDFRDAPSAAFPPEPLSGPTPSRTGGPTYAAPGTQGTVTPGGWASAPADEPGYDQPTWGTQRAFRTGATGGGQPRGPGSSPAYARAGQLPPQTPPRRKRGVLIAAIVAAALLVVIVSALAFSYFAGAFSGSSSPTRIAQQATATQQPSATLQPTDTATATLTPSPTATNTPVPTNTPKPTATPVPIVSSGTGTLQGTYSFNFDTGMETSTFPDVFWDQQTTVVRTMDPESGAKLVNVGVVNFNNITLSQLKGYSYGTTPIDGNNDSTNQLITGDVFAVYTHSGNYAKVLIVSYGYNLQIQWVTYFGG